LLQRLEAVRSRQRVTLKHAPFDGNGFPFSSAGILNLLVQHKDCAVLGLQVFEEGFDFDRPADIELGVATTPVEDKRLDARPSLRQGPFCKAWRFVVGGNRGLTSCIC
jgi:hypothetical protein